VGKITGGGEKEKDAECAGEPAESREVGENARRRGVHNAGRQKGKAGGKRVAPKKEGGCREKRSGDTRRLLWRQKARGKGPPRKLGKGGKPLVGGTPEGC